MRVSKSKQIGFRARTKHNEYFERAMVADKGRRAPLRAPASAARLRADRQDKFPCKGCKPAADAPTPSR